MQLKSAEYLEIDEINFGHLEIQVIAEEGHPEKFKIRFEDNKTFCYW